MYIDNIYSVCNFIYVCSLYCSLQPVVTSIEASPPVFDASASGLPLALARFPTAELRDVDCERVRSSIVDWPGTKQIAYYIYLYILYT